MSKNDTSKATTTITSSILANKAKQQQKRQSFLKRLAQPSNTTSTAISPTKSTPFLSTSYPPPSPPLPNSQPSNSKQQQQQQISRLRSVRLTLIASVSRHRPRCSSNVGASTVNTTINNTNKTLKSNNNNNNKKTNNATSTKPFSNINNVNIKKRQKKEEREHSDATHNIPPTKKRDRVDSSTNTTTSTTSNKGEQSFQYGHATSRNLLVQAGNKKVQIRKQQQQQTERCIEVSKPWPHKDKLHHTQKQRPCSQQSPPSTQSDDNVSLQACQQRQKRPLSQQPHLYQHEQYSSLDVKEEEVENKEKNEEDDGAIPTVVSSAASSSITASSVITDELLPPWKRSSPLSVTTTSLHFRQSSISSSSSSSSSVQTLTASNNNSTQFQQQQQDHHPVIKSKFLSKLNGSSSFVMALEENTTSLPPPPKQQRQQRKRSSHNNNTAATMLCDNNNKQSLAPVVSCSSIYPSFEPPNRRTTLPMVLLKSSLSIDRSTKIMKPTRAQTMFAVISSGVHKKEIKAISIWRETVNNLLLVSDNSVDEIYHTNIESRQQHRQQMLTNKDRTLCKFIINELHTTEKSFHRLLKLIQTRYMHPMIIASQEPSSLVKESDIPVLFRHLPEMLQLSEKIVQCFEDIRHPHNNINHGGSMINRNHQRMTSSSSMLSTSSSVSANSSYSLIRVGRMFQMLEQEMVVFLKYAVHYEAHSKLIRRACNNVVFLKIEQESLTRRDTNRMGISDYLIAPFQRVPRYCLLIKDLIKHTDRNDPQFAELDVALKMLTGLTVAMDHIQKIPR
ncbi:hypothetical protein INT45_009441 [Circinella minor]|uniref:DH domain-containing protein n=1 Tax=Circinella minor TaxID=1195481 RepID=A0A8H7VPP0_9FUNG|nr:hypothetical protein INT45_009441 [Circinella minor]